MVRFYSVSVILMFSIYLTNGFNISPKPNLVFKEPKLKTYKTSYRSSYFGLTINLRRSSLIIGAPRAQSSIESQRDINETGAIYKCSLTGTCAPFKFDTKANMHNLFDGTSYNGEVKDNQWLGGSIDGGSEDKDNLVVCAPRQYADTNYDYHLHGICYLTSNTLTDNPKKIEKITPLRLEYNQVRGLAYNHMMGEEGISAHITDDNKEILMGAPGIYNWRGSVIKYNINSKQSVVPSPTLKNKLHLQSTSYFGYAVTSGNFDSKRQGKIFYVGTAPRSNELLGEAYIFEIVSTITGYVIKPLAIFRGSQFGEYFGYAVLAEDINGDGLKDLIFTAPLYHSEENFDQGAIYVYLNMGNLGFNPQATIISPINGRSRFGSAIAKLGDINHDGFNDIAVGAPFADNGVVFIYLGSKNGLRQSPSQKLNAILEPKSWGEYMFGHGLSKGVDFDGNGFNDLAIGAPNAESVYVYRTYPVVKIEATIKSMSRTIAPKQNKFQINVCYSISTTSKEIQNHDVTLRMKIDSQIERVTLQGSKSGKLNLTVAASLQEQCILFDALVKYSPAYIYKPIELELEYELVNGVPDSEEFCNKCAAVDPDDPKMKVSRIILSTGCKTKICQSDLILTSSGLPPTFILGSTTPINITYEVLNSGETAFLPQINITSSIPMPYAKIPSSCNKIGDALLCDLNRGQLMHFNSRNNITIVYDASQIDGTSVNISASVFSTGGEKNPANNHVQDVIVLKEYTEIEAIGKPLTPGINLTKVVERSQAELIYGYEIKSSGPSRIQVLEIALEIPVAYISHGSSVPIPIIDVGNMTVEGICGQQILATEFIQDQELPLNEEDTSTPGIISKDLNARTYKEISSKDEYEKLNQTEALELLGENLVGTLPINRTIVFSCTNHKRAICARAAFRAYNFVPDTPVIINITYYIDLEKIDNILIEPWEFFVIIPNIKIVKTGDEEGKTIKITKKVDYTVISKYQSYTIPLWVIILSALGGLLVLAAIAYGMRKAGFFRRKKKEHMDRIIQQHKRATQEAIAKFIEETKNMENTEQANYAEILEKCKE